jgi:hypothetical protein
MVRINVNRLNYIRHISGVWLVVLRLDASIRGSPSWASGTGWNSRRPCSSSPFRCPSWRLSFRTASRIAARRETGEALKRRMIRHRFARRRRHGRAARHRLLGHVANLRLGSLRLVLRNLDTGSACRYLTPMSPTTRITVGGAPEGFDARLLLDEADRSGGRVVHVARDDKRMQAMREALAFFAPGMPVFTFPSWDCLPFDRVSPNPDISAARMATLAALTHAMPRASCC